MNQMMLNNFTDSERYNNYHNIDADHNTLLNTQKYQFTFNHETHLKHLKEHTHTYKENEDTQSKSDTSTISLTYSFEDKRDKSEGKGTVNLLKCKKDN